MNLREHAVPRAFELQGEEVLGVAWPAVEEYKDGRTWMRRSVQKEVLNSLDGNVLGREFFSHANPFDVDGVPLPGALLFIVGLRSC